MRSRGLAIGLLVGVACGALGAYLAGATRTAEPETSPAREGGAVGEENPGLHVAPTDVAGLRDRLAKSEARVRELETKLASAPAAAAPSVPAQKVTEEIPARALADAARLHVSDAALQALWRARNEYWGAPAETKAQLIESLRPYGEEIVNGVVALMNGGGGHIDLPDIVADLHLDRGADLVIRAVEDEPYAAHLVRALSGYDSPRVRDWLLERVGDEGSAGALWPLAETLGALHEPRGAEAIRVRQITGPEAAGVRGNILYAVGQMGGPGAVRFLQDYLAIANADHLGAALAALATVDPGLARTHAQRIHDSDRYAFLDVVDRVQVNTLIKDR